MRQIDELVKVVAAELTRAVLAGRDSGAKELLELGDAAAQEIDFSATGRTRAPTACYMAGAMEYREIERIALTIMDAHGCHTTILYGSHARGDATSHSDLDLVCIREDGPAVRDARVVDGVYIDAFIYPEARLKTLEPSLLRLLGGTVIRERGGFGAALMAQLRELHDRGPAPLPDDERRALTIWSQKMLDRFRGQRGVDADYRRSFLVVQALEDYFVLRNTWFPGSKEAFAWLREHDGSTYALFERAACPGAGDDAFSDLVQAVYRSREPSPS
ncbi:nucleotidyltransferase domain-containing protein [Sorangium sp. So ce1151]|uniref:nucleotidyltransferase domain-containing protein n=1 Tax=Sorangium sp. So ce1151 TaxID=3133332 RepID=UPI003F60F3D8